MQKFIEKHWQTILITLAALVILAAEYAYAPAHLRLAGVSFQNPFFVAMGKWAIRFLLISLAITPIYTLTRWRFVNRLRKPAGLLAFAFVSLHVLIYLTYMRQSDFFTLLTSPNHVFWGVVAYVILLMMALTSFQSMMKRLGKQWKRLHRLVYVAGVLIMAHSLTAALNGKRVAFGGEESARELAVYAVLMAIFLALRVPFIKRPLQRLTQRRPKTHLAPSSAATP